MQFAPRALQDRLVEFSVAVCDALRRVPVDRVQAHVANQLMRSSTSAAANYAEAWAAESRRDFVHKMQICLKELRETAVWMRLADRLSGGKMNAGTLAKELDELTAIFVKSINTARLAGARSPIANR